MVTAVNVEQLQSLQNTLGEMIYADDPNHRPINWQTSKSAANDLIANQQLWLNAWAKVGLKGVICGDFPVSALEALATMPQQIRVYVRVYGNQGQFLRWARITGGAVEAVKPPEQPKYKPMTAGKYAGKTLDAPDVPPQYVYFVKRVRPAWADMIEVTRRIQEIEQQFA